MNQSRIDGILRANEDRVTLFVSDCVMVYNDDAAIVSRVYEQGRQIDFGTQFPIADLTAISRTLRDQGFTVSVMEDQD